MSEPFGDLARRLRTESEVSLRTVSKQLGWTPTYVSDIERGRRSAPTVAIARKWAEVIGADPELLADAAFRDRRVVEFPVDPETDKGQALALLARSWSDLTPDQEEALMRQVAIIVSGDE